VSVDLDATVAGPTANAYCDADTAQAYFDGRPFAAAWTAASLSQREQALVYATMLLDREKWVGIKGTTTTGGYAQALAWPRRWAQSLEFDQQADYIAEYFVDTTIAYYSSLTIPVPIIRATCELALAVLNAGTTDPFIDGTRNIRSERVDVLDTVYLDVHLRTRGLGLFPQVVALVAPLLRSQSQGAQMERI
jgi:hypothetical protein